MSQIAVRILAGAAAAALAVVAGVLATGTFDPTQDPAGIPAGSNLLMLILAIALLVGFAAYAAVEWAQTRRLDSIARQLSTRTIVLMAIAIPINIVLGQVVGSALRLPLYLDSIGTILVGVLAGPIAGAATGLLSNLTWTFVLGGTPLGSPYAWPFAIVAAEIGLVAGLFGYAGVFRSRPSTPMPDLVAGMVVAGAFLAGLAIWGVLPHFRDLCPEVGANGNTTASCLDALFGGATDPVVRGFGILLLAGLGVALLAVLVRLVRSRDLGVAYVLVAGAACGVLSALIAAPIAAMLGGVTGSGTDLLVALFQQAGENLEEAVLQQSLISDPIDKAITFVVVFTVLASLSRRVVARFPQGERVVPTTEA